MAPIIKCSIPSTMKADANPNAPITSRSHPTMSQLPRRDLRRTYPGISPSRQQNTSSTSNDLNQSSFSHSEPIYMDIEHNTPEQQRQQQPQTYSDRVSKSPPSKLNMTDTTAETHLSHPSVQSSPSSYSYKGPFDTDAARERGIYTMASTTLSSNVGRNMYYSAYDYRNHLHPPILQGNNSNDSKIDDDTPPPIVFRDNLDESVMSSMSQQELIRKQVRANTNSKRRNYNHNHRKKKKPIVQLPAGLLHSTGTSTSRSPSPHSRRIPHYPKAHYYQPTNNSDNNKKQEQPKRSRWNVVKAFSKSYEEELESSTAESTKESEPQHLQLQQQWSMGLRSPSAGADTTGPSNLDPSLEQQQHEPPRTSTTTAEALQQEASRKKKLPHLAISGDDTLLVEETRSIGTVSVGEMSFPILSKTGSHEIMEQEQQARSTQKKGEGNTDAASHASSSTNSSLRRGVRFAGTIATTHCCDEDSSQIPWDEKASIQKKNDSSPTSVIVGGRLNAQNGKPKSILRTPRFKPIPGIRYYDQRTWNIAQQGLTRTTTVEPTERSTADFSQGNDSETEPRVVLDYYAADESLDNLSNKHSIGEKSEEMHDDKTPHATNNNSIESSPPRKEKGFIEGDTSLQISPILPASTDGTLPSISEPLSHLVGHPAEKHLLNTMATVRQMHGGEIANQVIKDEEYPDPPLDIIIGDDDTVASAYAFIETVAAIVIQTAVRRHLAICHAMALREKLLAEKDEAEQRARNTPNEKHRLVIKVPSRVSDLLLQTKSSRQRQKQQDEQKCTDSHEKYEIILGEGRPNAAKMDNKNRASELPREITTISKEKQLHEKDCSYDLASAHSYSKSFDIEGKTKRDINLQELVNRQVSDRTSDESRFNSEQRPYSAFYEIAAILIQSMWRGFWVRDMLDVDIYCATLIQKTFRGFLCRSRYHEDLGRIVLVQSWWRRNIARDQAAITLAHVIVIQSVYRGHRIRKLVREHRAAQAREIQRKAALPLRSGLKARQLLKECRAERADELERKESAAIVIQTRWRTFVSEAKFIRDLVDILIVQAIVRRWLACNQVTRIRQQREMQHHGSRTIGDSYHKGATRELQLPDNLNSFSFAPAKSRPRAAIDPGASDSRRATAVSDPPEIVNQVVVCASISPAKENGASDGQDGLESGQRLDVPGIMPEGDLQMVEPSPSDEHSMPSTRAPPRNASLSAVAEVTTIPIMTRPSKTPPATSSQPKVAAYTAIFEKERKMESPGVDESAISNANLKSTPSETIHRSPPRYQPPKSRPIVAYPDSYIGEAKSKSKIKHGYEACTEPEIMKGDSSLDRHKLTQNTESLTSQEGQLEQESSICARTFCDEQENGTIVIHSPSDEIFHADGISADRPKRDTSPGRAALLKNGTTTSLVSMWKEKEKKNALS